MAEFERYLDELEGVLAHLDSAPSSAQVRSQIARDLRVIDKDTFYELCQEAAARIDPAVDVAKPFENKYFSQLKKEMEAVCLVGPRRVEHAQRLIEGYVAAESDRCPVDAKWLLARGVSKGPSLGRTPERVQGALGRDGPAGPGSVPRGGGSGVRPAARRRLGSA